MSRTGLKEHSIAFQIRIIALYLFNPSGPMSKYIRIIDTSVITPRVEHLAEGLPPWYSLKQLLKAWFVYHLWDLQTVMVGSLADLQFANTLPKEFLEGDDFAIKRLYLNSMHEVAPANNRCYHDRAELLVMPASVILVYRLK